MKPLEDELRRALRRREPPPGFTQRVLARVRQEAGARSLAGVRSEARPAQRAPWARWSLFGSRIRLGLAAVATVLLLAVSLSVWRQRREEQERIAGAAARAQVMEALRITSAKLNRVRARVAAATDDSGSERLAD
jgi:hypothetical protein